MQDYSKHTHMTCLIAASEAAEKLLCPGRPVAQQGLAPASSPRAGSRARNVGRDVSCARTPAGTASTSRGAVRRYAAILRAAGEAPGSSGAACDAVTGGCAAAAAAAESCPLGSVQSRAVAAICIVEVHCASAAALDSLPCSPFLLLSLLCRYWASRLTAVAKTGVLPMKFLSSSAAPAASTSPAHAIQDCS